MLTPDQLLQSIEKLRVAVHKGRRAPHKPLLLLYALGRIQRGEPRLVRFGELERPLTELIAEYGTSGTPEPMLPYWHLQADGLWTVPAGDTLPMNRNGKRPLIEPLRQTAGGFPEEVDQLLRSDPDLVRRVAHQLLDEHFAPSLHSAILAQVGLGLERPRQTFTRLKRDPRFREEVLHAYANQCAVCGLDAQLDRVPVGLEAAHVQWHSHDGPDRVDNGLCLCVWHHQVLDLGLLGLELDRDRRRLVLVSARVSGGQRVEETIGRYHKQPLIGPREGQPPVAPGYAEWHTVNVFKAPGRAA